ncbi:MAG: N-6 DNA methylase [Candidatus Zixiibacteriota bacterium]
MARSTIHYADTDTNNILKRLHNKLRPAGTPVERVEYIIELLLLRIFEAKLKQDEEFKPLRNLFKGERYRLLFSHLLSLTGDQVLAELNKSSFPFYATILTKSRDVIKGNLPTKIQDQLVLMEEVFANSNFTNNVKGGVIAEVIGLVHEIEEQRILRTDLLGDAIESALSETGGTQALGLYRTPDHIRRMMIEMVDPDFTDTIFDPACGTAGFLFDAYEYVIEKARKTRKFPPAHVANQFYRTGIGGIEYQGRIRKMAAVNMYIRGLNPHNIDQGDSLKAYDPGRDAASKTVVIANPPFGAERDQPAYPNVWEDFAKESETTILFVKLMFDLLRVNGRCAVVVSEGFLTWDQNSACALRKLLLNDANLRAIVSLPQGVFVSKNGQGAKTSILYFEKGNATNFVWHYRIDNDGFSMGTTRKTIDGSQIPEMLTLFREVKRGKLPKDTARSFSLPKEWIETLDPRAIERLRREVESKLQTAASDRRAKLRTQLQGKKDKGAIDNHEFKERIRQLDAVLEAQRGNEIAKAIERAHSFSFNLISYRSELSDDAVAAWHNALAGVVAAARMSVEEKYSTLHSGVEVKKALTVIASLDPRCALHVDIVREYLDGLPDAAMKRDKSLRELDKVVKTSGHHDRVVLRTLVTQRLEKAEIVPAGNYKQLTVRLYGKGVVLRQEIAGRDIKTNNQSIGHSGDIVLSRIDARNGAFGIIPPELDGAILSQDFPVLSVNSHVVIPEFLEFVLQSKPFYNQIEQLVSGATGRRRAEVEVLLELKVPFPPLARQAEIVEIVRRQRQILQSADSMIKSYSVDIGRSPAHSISIELGRVCEFVYGDPLPEGKRVDGPYPVYGAGNIIGYHDSFIAEGPVIVIGRRGATSGTVMWSDSSCWPIDTAFWVRVTQPEKVMPRYLYYVLLTLGLAKHQSGGAMPGVNRNDIYREVIALPSLTVQTQAVKKLDNLETAMAGVRLLRSDAEQRLEDLIADLWME